MQIHKHWKQHLSMVMCAVQSGSSFSVNIFSAIYTFFMQTAKAQIRLHKCSIWSGPSLFANALWYCPMLNGPFFPWKSPFIHNSPVLPPHYFFSFQPLTILLLSTTCPVLANSVDPDQLASEEANWSGSALFVIKYVNFYQKPGSSNLIGWKLEVGMPS